MSTATDDTFKTFRLMSTSMINASGVVRYAMALHRSGKRGDKKRAREIMRSWPIPGVTDRQLDAILAGGRPSAVVHAVVFHDEYVTLILKSA